MSNGPRIVFITPTWAGDLEHFRVMRSSFEHSPLASFPHYVVVQDEDLELFSEFRDRPGLTLLSTADVLPEEVERGRVRARFLSDRLGRNVTRICGSLKRFISWPSWPSYTGWHTQQLCKLKLAAELDCDKAVVIDSDVVVTPHASAEDFSSDSGVLCFADWQSRNELKGKVRNWVFETERVVGAERHADPVNVYFDTPFVFDNGLLCSALNELESGTAKRWWSALLDLPPRRWSEFGFYKAYLTLRVPKGDVDWREPTFFRYVYDTSSAQTVIETVREMIADPRIHYVTIHSQASGRENWDPQAYLKPLLSLFENGS